MLFTDRSKAGMLVLHIHDTNIECLVFGKLDPMTVSMDYGFEFILKGLILDCSKCLTASSDTTRAN
jgi:hypothetical protein